MKQQKYVFWFVTALCLVVGVALLAPHLDARQASAPPSAAQAPTAQSEQSPSQAPPQQSPGQPGQPSQPSGPSAQPSAPQSEQPAQQAPGPQAGSTPVQTFTGTIVKSGDKYVLQDSAAGTSYDIDHQDLVAQHAGRRVRVSGILDADGKTIHLQPSTHQ